MAVREPGHQWGHRSGFQVRAARHGDWTVLQVAGDLDLATVQTLEQELVRAAATGTQVALELSRLAFMDSSGLNVVIRWWKRLHAGGGQLMLVNPSKRVTLLLTTTGLDRFIPVRSTLPVIPTDASTEGGGASSDMSGTGGSVLREDGEREVR
ncbi:hypothetical protein GCM10009678_74860 [Actinomadura kijaniata]